MSDRGGCNWENHPERYCVTDYMVYITYEEIKFVLDLDVTIYIKIL